MPFQGWLWLDDCEVLNDARFEANMQKFVGCGGNTGRGTYINWLRPVSPQLSWDPCRRDTPTKLNYADPLLRPWYDPNLPDESTSFLGYYVLETTFDSTYSREISQRGSTRAGANFSRLRRQHREIAITVVLGAENDYGLQYGFDWLSEKLASCNSMRLTNAMIRLSGAQPDDIWQDLWMLEGLGITDPLKWGDAPLPMSACRLRQASFVISASDPDRRTCPERLLDPTYFYEPGTVPTECMEGMKFLCGPFPDERICVHMPGPGQLGTTDAIVTIVAGSNGCPPLHVYGALDRWGWPCGDKRLEKCMDIHINGLNPFETLTVDSTHQRVWVESPATGFEKVDAIGYLIPPEEGIPKFISVANCDAAWLWVEPANACGLDDETTVSMDYVHRVLA